MTNYKLEILTSNWADKLAFLSYNAPILDGVVQYIPVGAEIEGIGADDIEELSENEDDYYKLGAEDDEFKDYASLKLKPDHANRWIMAQHLHSYCHSHCLCIPIVPAKEMLLLCIRVRNCLTVLC